MNLQRCLRLAWPWLLIVIAGLLAAWLRYGLIEQPSMEHRCDGAGSPLWCAWRMFAVHGFLSYAYGYAAMAAAVLALCWKHPFAAWLAAALGAFALLMYCSAAGAPVLLIGCLRLLRWQATRGGVPVGEHRHRNGQIQPQP